MRVCLITPCFPPAVGGVAQASARRAAQLAMHGSVSVFTPENWPCHAEHARALFAQKPWDLIHGYYPSLTGAISQQLGAWTNTPYVLSARGNDLDRDIWKAESRPGLLTAMGQASVLTGVSRDLTRKLKALVPHVPASYVPNSVDVHRFSPVSPLQKQALREHWLLPEGICLGFVGEMRTKKGFSLLLKSFARLHRESNISVYLVVVGPIREGEDQSLYCLWCQQFPEAAQALVHLPAVEHGALHRLYPVLDFLVMPSFQEGMANAALEAMSSGIPVIATDVGGFPDLIDSEVSGLLLPPYSESQLFEALQTAVYEKGLSEKWGQAARKKVLECFQESHENKAYDLVYQRALQHQSS